MKKTREVYWPDNKFYFITTTTFLHFPYFRFYEQKKIVLDRFYEVEKKMNITIPVFSIAINHFHYLTFLEKGMMYPKLKQLMNGGISRAYKKIFLKKYREMWQSTKAVIIHREKAYWLIIGYIIGNLLKHKEVNTFRQLYNNKFSTYKQFVDEYGEDLARELIYRVIDLEEDKKSYIDSENFKKVPVQDILDKRGLIIKGLKSSDPN